jgi:hypothetical protein
MRGVYSISFDQQTIAAASGDYDFFEITPADDKPVEIVAIFLGNKSEVKDAEEEMVAWSIVRGHATSGNGTAATPRQLDPSDGAASFAAETVGSTPASTGTPLNLHVDTFNIRTGLQIIFPPDMRPKCSQADTTIVVRLLTALADDATFSGTLYVKEL